MKLKGRHLMRFDFRKLLVTFALASLPLMAQAQPGMANGQPELTAEQKQLVSELQQAQMAFKQTEASVQQLEQKALNQSKDLQKKRAELEAIVSKKMNSKGYDAKKEAAELKAIMQKYQNAKEKPSDQVIADFQKRQQTLQQKQLAAMQDPEVQKTINAFNEAMLKEAKKIEPNTEALLARMQSQIQKIQLIRQKMQATLVKP